MAINQDAMTPEEQIFEHFTATDSLFQDEISEEENVQAAPEEDEDAEDTEIEVDEVEEDDEDDEDSESDEESDAPWMPNSLDELAEALKVDMDDIKSIRVKTKVDGVEGEATLAEVIKNYQLNKSLTERSEAIARERKQFQEYQEALQQQAKAFEEKLADAESLTMMAEERLKREIGAIDWDQLRADDPAEYAVRRQDYMEKIGELEASKQKIIRERQEQFQKQQQEWMERRDKILRENQEKLLEAVPEMRDPDVRTKEVNELKNYLRSQNISDEEINNIVDYRMIVLARKAKAYDEMQTKVKPAKAKAKTKPKFTKPGSVTTKADADSQQIARRHKRAAKTQNVDDWAKALEDRLF